jgi:hypothetical protein
MAGHLSLYHARDWRGFTECAHCDGDPKDFASLADLKPGVGEPGHMDPDLRNYYTHGPGAAKIGWGIKGAFRRCVGIIRKFFPKNPEGTCANLHKAATGEWPTEHGKAGIPS